MLGEKRGRGRKKGTRRTQLNKKLELLGSKRFPNTCFKPVLMNLPIRFGHIGPMLNHSLPAKKNFWTVSSFVVRI